MCRKKDMRNSQLTRETEKKICFCIIFLMLPDNLKLMNDIKSLLKVHRGEEKADGIFWAGNWSKGKSPAKISSDPQLFLKP